MCSCRATPVGQLAGQAPEKPICGAVVVPSDGLEPSTPLYEDPSLEGIHPRIGCLSTQDDEGKFPDGSLCYLDHRPDEDATGRSLHLSLTRDRRQRANPPFPTCENAYLGSQLGKERSHE